MIFDIRADLEERRKIIQLYGIGINDTLNQVIVFQLNLVHMYNNMRHKMLFNGKTGEKLFLSQTIKTFYSSSCFVANVNFYSFLCVLCLFVVVQRLFMYIMYHYMDEKQTSLSLTLSLSLFPSPSGQLRDGKCIFNTCGIKCSCRKQIKIYGFMVRNQ